MTFIYAGENERLVNSVNFRKTSIGGLGVVNPLIKSKALLIKSMNKEFGKMSILGGKVYDEHRNEFQTMRNESLCLDSSKVIYDHLLETITHREGVLIPSRNESRSVNTNWSVVFNNSKLVV